MITASSLERAKRCPGSTALPQRDIPTEAAAAGTERHAGYEARINDGDIPEDLEARWPGLKWAAEVRFAFDLATGKGRELGRGSGRDYSDAGPFDLVGTADAVGVGPGTLVIVDWKSFQLVPAAAGNPQLAIAALALSRAYGLTEATVAIHYEARPMDVAELDALDLDAFASEAREILDAAGRARAMVREGLELPLAEGPWCKHCPATFDCPRQKELQAQIERHPALVAADKAMLPFADDDDAAAAYEFVERAEALVKRIKAALYARSYERPIPLRNGRMFGPREKLGNREIDGDAAYKLIREQYGQEVADQAVTREATQAGIEAALKAADIKPVKTAKDKLVKALEEKGAIVRKKKTTVEEYEPVPQLVEQAS